MSIHVKSRRIIHVADRMVHKQSQTGDATLAEKPLDTLPHSFKHEGRHAVSKLFDAASRQQPEPDMETGACQIWVAWVITGGST